MNILLSLNYKCFKMKPESLIRYIKNIDELKIVKGFEVNASTDDDKKYLIDLANECNKNSYILNIHLPSLSNIEEYKQYLNYINSITNIYNKKINMVLHPIYSKNKNESIKNTEKYVYEILKYIKNNNYNVCLSIENLNNINGNYRLKKEDFKNLLEKYEELKFTYDIGHEYIDNSLKYGIDNIYIKKMSNIHVHTFKEKEDHYPIEEIDEILLNKLIEIKSKGYDNNIVLEYALDYINGDNFHEKLRKYIKYSEIMNNYIN